MRQRFFARALHLFLCVAKYTERLQGHHSVKFLWHSRSVANICGVSPAAIFSGHIYIAMSTCNFVWEESSNFSAVKESYKSHVNLQNLARLYLARHASTGIVINRRPLFDNYLYAFAGHSNFSFCPEQTFSITHSENQVFCDHDTLKAYF